MDRDFDWERRRELTYRLNYRSSYMRLEIDRLKQVVFDLVQFDQRDHLAFALGKCAQIERATIAIQEVINTLLDEMREEEEGRKENGIKTSAEIEKEIEDHDGGT